MRLSPLAVPALALLAAACAATVLAPAGSEPVDARYAVSGGSYTTGGDIIAMLRVREAAGEVVLCGALTRTRESAVSIRYGHFVLGTGVVTLGDARLAQGLHRFPEHALRDDMTGVEARCYATGVAWRPGFAETAPRVRFARLALGSDSFGPETVFRQSQVPDVIARR